MQTFGCLGNQMSDDVQRHFPIRFEAVLHHVAKGRAVHIVHDQRVLAVGLRQVVDRVRAAGRFARPSAVLGT